MRTITLQLPENLYIRLHQAALATGKSLDEITLHAVRTGIPPDWEDVPAEFQSDIAALNRLDDTALWKILRRKSTETENAEYERLLNKNAEGTISESDAAKLQMLRKESNFQILCKAHAAALLRWRGHPVPPAEKL